MSTPNTKSIIIGAVILLVAGTAIYNYTQKPQLGQINTVGASERICSVSQFKDCTIDEQNALVSTLNNDLEEQNKLIVDLGANLEKAKTNKTNIENQKALVISSRDAKLTK